jgi:hypothetical protein
MSKKRSSEQKTDEYFLAEKTKFAGLLKHTHLIGNKIGRREADHLRIMASWLFMRAGVTGQSIVQLYDPPLSGFGSARYLDFGSIAALSRALIENIAVLLYIGDTSITADEWMCRKHLIDLHDFANRREFLELIKYDSSARPQNRR